MQEGHGFAWKALLDTIDVDVRDTKVLDVGCNRGGFLRLLCDEYSIREGFGYDPAPAAVADARALSDGRPLSFAVGAAVPAAWRGFDVAFSHEVLYLVRDLSQHAAMMYDALEPGASYFAVTGVHDESPRMVDWHASTAEELDLPPLRPIDDIVDTFVAGGFQAAAARLRMGFVPAAGHTPGLVQWLDYYYEHKLLLRLTRQL
jgi:SAM-dependent methyltransferase